ncbi:KUP/HAK/KT family potassium transporter [Bradyrhizobium sp. MOS001]|uniref:potassium transporter Kup n=1 Tax=Bradyrhizobium sp. MOS001 TaxID=2133948 RepID=UPI001432072C|nr:KUP/HAK/KT family potassium transporter [Bradyrhizobium sp. MOS001]
MAAQAKAALLALGIVYGDLGTSPLYTVQVIAQIMGDRFTAEAALGSLSLIVWALILTVSLKYCWFVMRADNQGEGGILALMTMTGAQWAGRGRWWIVAGLFGAALLYGDGIITPAISVLSAVEGLTIATDWFVPYTVPIAVAILVLLFAIQSRGTGTVGRAFAPIMLVWFVTIAMLGILGIWHQPEVLKAINPLYGFELLIMHRGIGIATLGGVFLALTGGEALYADMGQVGRRPMRIAWYCVVLPALVLNYAGQIGNILNMGHARSPFFELAPSWLIYPLVVLATSASVIASQAIISGCFSMTQQAVQLGWLPATRIKHTSEDAYGQIYVPFVSWTMMIFTVALILGFGSASRLAGAYGTAVSITMVLTTLLLYKVLQMRRSSTFSVKAALLTAIFLSVDLGFLSACMLKIGDGAWIPLTIGGLVFATMVIWHSGAAYLHCRSQVRSMSPAQFFELLNSGRIVRAPGTAIFLTRLSENIPPIIVNYARRTGSLQKTVVLLSVTFERLPRVAPRDRIRISRLAEDFWRINVHLGFFEDPDLPSVLLTATNLGGPLVCQPSYFIERLDVVSRGSRTLPFRLQICLFSIMLRNSARVVDRFKVPPATLIELGRRIDL